MKWHKIPGLTGYEITRSGEIRSWVDKGGHPRAKPHIKKPTQRKSGPYVNIKAQAFNVSYLLALTFLGRPPTRNSRAIPINGDPNDLRIENLQWHRMNVREIDTVVEMVIDRVYKQYKIRIIREVSSEIRKRSK